MNDSQLRLSVVVATLGRAEPVRVTLLDLLEQDPFEVVVVDQSCAKQRASLSDWVDQLGDERLRFIGVDWASLTAARNLGVRETSGEVVLFVDDDVLLQPKCLSAHLACYDRADVGGVVGRIAERSVRPNTRKTRNCVGWDGRVRTNLWGVVPQPIATLKGANMSFRRQALIDAGPFDLSYTGTALLEDADISTRVRRAGYALWFEPSAEVIHLSAPCGGVRVGSALDTEAARFRNTGFFVGRYRGILQRISASATFTLVAAKRAIELRETSAVSTLMNAFYDGMRRGQRAEEPEW